MDSFISWVGGKRLLRKKILAQSPPDYDIIEVDRQDNLAAGASQRRYKELIIKNY